MPSWVSRFASMWLVAVGLATLRHEQGDVGVIDTQKLLYLCFSQRADNVFLTPPMLWSDVDVYARKRQIDGEAGNAASWSKTVTVTSNRFVPTLVLPSACGSKLDYEGTADFSPWFHYPGFHFGPFTHSSLSLSSLVSSLHSRAASAQARSWHFETLKGAFSWRGALMLPCA